MTPIRHTAHDLDAAGGGGRRRVVGVGFIRGRAVEVLLVPPAHLAPFFALGVTWRWSGVVSKGRKGRKGSRKGRGSNGNERSDGVG